MEHSRAPAEVTCAGESGGVAAKLLTAPITRLLRVNRARFETCDSGAVTNEMGLDGVAHTLGGSGCLAKRFAIGPLATLGITSNHDNPKIDRVLFENLRFAVVEKLPGIGASLARTSNPRS